MRLLTTLIVLPLLMTFALSGCTKSLDKLLDRKSSFMATYANTGAHIGVDLTGAISAGISKKKFEIAAIPNSGDSVGADGATTSRLTSNRGDDLDSVSAILWSSDGAEASISGGTDASGVILLGSGMAFGTAAGSLGMADCLRGAAGNSEIAKLCRTPAE